MKWSRHLLNCPVGQSARKDSCCLTISWHGGSHASISEHPSPYMFHVMWHVKTCSEVLLSTTSNLFTSRLLPSKKIGKILQVQSSPYIKCYQLYQLSSINGKTDTKITISIIAILVYNLSRSLHSGFLSDHLMSSTTTWRLYCTNDMMTGTTAH